MRREFSGIAAWCAVCLVLAVGDVALAEDRMLSLSEAVNLALAQNPDIQISEQETKAAGASRNQTFGKLLPRLDAQANVIRWEEEQTLSFGSGGGSAADLPAPETPYEEIVKGMVENAGKPVTVREEVTQEASVSVTQPITGLVPFSMLYKIKSYGLDAAELQYDDVRSKTTLDCVTAYFRLLQTTAQHETAKKSVQNLEEQTRRMELFEQRGAASRSDVLKIRVAQASARQSEIRARSAVEVAQANIAVVLNLSPDVRIVPRDLAAVEPPALSVEPLAVLNDAQAARPDFQRSLVLEKQATMAGRVVWAPLFPEINAVGTYQWSDGSEFSDDETYFGGLFLKWNLWEWGGTYFGIKEAGARRMQAAIARRKASSLVWLDISRSLSSYRSSLEAFRVADAALADAEEVYRIETLRFEQNLVTAIELLDAEASLTQARTNRSSAYYECLIEYAALLRANGKSIRPETFENGQFDSLP